MKTLPTQKEAVHTLFESMTLYYDEKQYPEVNLIYQFIFTDIDDGYPITLTFRGGKCSFQEGLSEKPTVTIRTPSDVWFDISGGYRNAVWALITKKYAVTGDMSALRLLPKLIRKEFDIPRTKPLPENRGTHRKAVVFIGNPRRKNGFTWFYLEPFLEGIRSAGTATEVIHLYEKNIQPCRGCFQCWIKTPGRCVIRDDQAELNDKLNTADLIVYALPLYYHSVPGKVKDHLDRQIPRLYPYIEGAGNMSRHPMRVSKKQDIVLFSICGFPEIEQFDALKTQFEAYARQDNTTLAATVLLPGAILTYYNPTNRRHLLKKLDLLRSAGEQVVRTGTVKKGTLKGIGKVHGSLDEWRRGANFYWHHELEMRQLENKRNVGDPVRDSSQIGSYDKAVIHASEARREAI